MVANAVEYNRIGWRGARGARQWNGKRLRWPESRSGENLSIQLAAKTARERHENYEERKEDCKNKCVVP